MHLRDFSKALLWWLLSTTMVVCAYAQQPDFPPDPGTLFVPATVTIMGQEVEVTDPEDTTKVLEEIDILGDSTLVYNTTENTLTLNSVNLEAGDSLTSAISYSGSEPLTIVLTDSSTIFADTAISTTSDIIITGEGVLVAEAVVPILGVPTASILFDSVTMHVRSLISPAAVRRRIRARHHPGAGMPQVDEDGGPALSGFASADFNKTEITPPDADYGEVEVEDAPWAGGEDITLNALFVINDEGKAEVLTEFDLRAIADTIGPPPEAVEETAVTHTLDLTRPMYNLLGQPVDHNYVGIVIQDKRKYIKKK